MILEGLLKLSALALGIEEVYFRVNENLARRWRFCQYMYIYR